MPKSRKRHFVTRKHERRLKQVAAFDQAARVKILVQRLPNQAAYDAFLLQETDPERRKQMYEFTRGFCAFANPQCPSPLTIGGLVDPNGRPVSA